MLDYFFVARPDSGKKEGEEHKRNMFFFPKSESVDRQTELTGFAEAVANFTENFLEPNDVNKDCRKEFEFRTVSTQKAEHVFIMVENGEFMIGISVSKQLAEISSYPLFVPTIRSLIINAYKTFRLFFGTFSSLRTFDEAKFKERLDFFFARYIPLLKLHKNPLLDHLGGVEFQRLDERSYLNVVSLMNELCEEFSLVEKVMFLYQDKLLYYTIEQEDLPCMFRYLTENLLPTSIGPELDVARSTVKGRYLRGPVDLNSDAPLVGDESLPTVYLHTVDAELKSVQKYNMIVYRCLNSTVCMFVRQSNDGEQAISRRVLRNIDAYLDTDIIKLASRIGEFVDEAGDPSKSWIDFHYIYFNPESHSMLSTLSAKKILSADVGSASKIPFPPIEVNRICCESFAQYIDNDEKSGESFVKTESDWWVVFRKTNSRILVLLHPPSSHTQSLTDVQTKTNFIVKTHFENIFLS